MKVIVVKMRRDGVAIRKGDLWDQAHYQGHLTLNETQQNHLHRLAKTAKLTSDAEGTQVITSLIEPSTVWINEERFMLSGFEHAIKGGLDTDFAQSWLCMLGWEQSLRNEYSVASEAKSNSHVRSGRR